MHIYACDYLVHKIEYFDTEGELLTVAQLGDYESVAEGFDVPTKIHVRALASDGRADEMEIKLYDPKVKEAQASGPKSFISIATCVTWETMRTSTATRMVVGWPSGDIDGPTSKHGILLSKVR